jgi:ABC-type polysaccharide/polyol phosphate export permease
MRTLAPPIDDATEMLMPAAEFDEEPSFRAIDAPRTQSPGPFAPARRLDVYRGFRAAPLWLLLGWADIRLRYRRSVLGPFWITISMAVLIIVLGFVYSQIFHTDIHTYLPFLALGFIVWGFISSSANEACGAFGDSEAIIKQVGIPFSVFVFRVVWRNFLVVLHTIILVVPIWLIFKITPTAVSLLAIPGMALVFLNQCWLGICLAVLSTRYRDIPPIVATVLQITVFATPIMWPVSALGEKHFIADINPFYHLIEIVRGPLSGELPPSLSWKVAITADVLGFILATWMLQRARRTIVYWL